MESSSRAGRDMVGLLIAVLGIVILGVAILYPGLVILRDYDMPQLVETILAIIWGVGGFALIYIILNLLTERLSDDWKQAIQPYVFIGPAIMILMWYLALPTFRVFWLSLQDRSSDNFVGLANYLEVFRNSTLRTAFRNNLMWIVFGSSLSVAFGLLIAVLADRSSYEKAAKSLIFLPMAISMVGAGVIWNFIYEVKDASVPQIGLLNAIVTAFGGDPQAWTALFQPWNNFFLILIVIWLQTGFAMVLFSAALKGIPGELLEAARVDGATEIQVFFRIMIPYIMGTIITVSTTIILFTLKIFDIVWVMTGGQFDTQVIATQFYREYFTNRNFGYGSAIVIVLLIAVIPVMVYNLRQFNEREAF